MQGSATIGNEYRKQTRLVYYKHTTQVFSHLHENTLMFPPRSESIMWQTYNSNNCNQVQSTFAFAVKSR